MQCENYFCIYWAEGVCTLDEISLNILGSCQSCIYVDIDEQTLQSAKEKLLKQYGENS